MWVEFFAAVLFAAALLYVPGYFQIRALGLPRGASIACAPLVTVAEFVIAGVAYGVLGLAVSWVWVVAPAAILAVAALVVVLVGNRRSGGNGSIDPLHLAAYALFGLLVVFAVYVRAMDGAASYAQIYDNAFHLNIVHRYAETGVFSVLHASLGGTLPAGAVGPVDFYPAAWHVICALTSNALSVSAGIAENAVNTVFMGIVLPLSMCALMSFVFGGRRRIVLLGAFCVLAFGAYPWGMMTFGPLYSNMAAFALTGAVVYAFAQATGEGPKRAERFSWALLFVMGSISAAATQPNAIFTVAIMLAPLACVRIWRFALNRGASKKAAGFIVAAAVFAFAVVWLVLWASPMFSGVVAYPWGSFTSFWQAALNLVLLSLRASPVQLVLGVVVVIGLFVVVRDGKTRWVAAPYAFFCVAYVVCACSDGTFKTLFSGFWYNDPYRVAACVTLAAVPLAAAGLDAVVGFFSGLLGSWFRNGRASVVAATAVSVVFVAAVFAPSFSIGGRYYVETSIGKTEAGLTWLADPAVRKYDPKEAAFVEKAKEIVGEDTVVLNFPYDGSVFAYGESDLNVFFQTFAAAGSNDYESMCRNLDKAASDERVAGELASLGVGYVLQLDCNWPQGEGSVHEDLIAGREDGWRGLMELNESTPGFELVLSEGDMRLYRVVNVSR